MALIVSDTPAAMAGVFTRNRVRAAPVRLCAERLASGVPARAILVNSGCANACTGERGLSDAKRSAEMAAAALGLSPAEVWVCSTGTIGRHLPMDLLEAGIPKAAAALSREGGEDAAGAIMTTDTRPKTASAVFNAGGAKITIAGMAKGAGMIAPNMATMLAFLTTDAAISREALSVCLAKGVESSFNAITVDGDQSTNDTLLFMANGAAGNPLVERGGGAFWRIFRDAARDVMKRLALMIVADGEGATRLVSVTVKGARSRADARKAAMSAANSLLVKTSWFGADPNWGRLAAAVGYSGAEFDPELMDIFYDGLQAVKNGMSAGLPEAAVREVILKPQFAVTIDLHRGNGAFTAHTCDCSEEYVRINASYMT